MKQCFVITFDMAGQQISRGGVEKRVKGIEPSSVAWKATALPLSYTRAVVSCRATALLPSSFWRGSLALRG